MNERVMLQGLLAEKEMELKKLAVQADAIVVNIHTQCSPFVDLEDLPVEQISSQAVDLERILRVILRLKDESQKIKKELGIKDDE